MKKIFRLTESELHRLIDESISRVLKEEDNTLLLQSIAQGVIKKRRIDVYPNKNSEIEVYLEDNTYAMIEVNVECSPYIVPGWKSNDRDVPDDLDEIVDDPQIEILGIFYDNGDGDDWVEIDDNGLVKKALEEVIYVDYADYDIPTEDELYDYENYYNE